MLWYFSITLDDYEQTYAAQGGLCALCGNPETALDRTGLKVRKLAVDHDHRCCKGKRSCGKCARSLLCHSCNTKVGYLEMHVGAERLVAYLDRKNLLPVLEKKILEKADIT